MWVAFFDILGFEKLVIKSKTVLDFYRIKQDYEETIQYLRKNCDLYREDILEYTWFSDTFLIITQDGSPSAYVVIQQAAKHFLINNISSRVPFRGAVAYGLMYSNTNSHTFIGKALIEAYHYCEDQDWLGLILTPSAIKKAREYGLEPLDHDFVEKNIPMQEYDANNVLAYKLSSGRANHSSPLLPILDEMMHEAPEDSKHKYVRTIEHLKSHYEFIGCNNN